MKLSIQFLYFLLLAVFLTGCGGSSPSTPAAVVGGDEKKEADILKAPTPDIKKYPGK